MSGGIAPLVGRSPDHEPVFILLEAKSDPIPIFPGSKPPLPFTAQSFDELDADLFRVIGRDRIVTPDQVRGSYPTLEAGVKAGNWPKLKDARGKFVFLLLTALDTDGLSGYVGGHPNLEGRAAFLESKPGQSYGAFLLMDNATLRAGDPRAGEAGLSGARPRRYRNLGSQDQ
jgi:hypothetical protein